MKYKNINERIIKCAQYYIENGSTVRETAKMFNISKTTIHNDFVNKLKNIDIALYYNVRKILNKNKAENYLRGGLATKRKYFLLRKNNI